MGHDTRLLVVDDEDAIRALLLTVLRRRGFLVDTARNGADGMEKLRRCRYAVVLLDMMMPVASGHDVLDAIGKLAPADRPMVIVLTAGGNPRYLDPELVAGTIRKPFDVELLVDTIAAGLQAAAKKQQFGECPPAESEEVTN